MPQQKHALVRLHLSAITLNRRIRWMRSSFGDLHGSHAVSATLGSIPHEQASLHLEQKRFKSSFLLLYLSAALCLPLCSTLSV